MGTETTITLPTAPQLRGCQVGDTVTLRVTDTANGVQAQVVAVTKPRPRTAEKRLSPVEYLRSRQTKPLTPVPAYPHHD